MPRVHPKIVFGAAALVALIGVLALAATRSRVSAATGTATDGRIQLVLDDFRFVPQTVHARAGTLTFALRNDGIVNHNLRLLREGRTALEDLPSLAPGTERTVTLRVQRGTYRMVSSIGNQEELGMAGLLVVR